MSEQGSRRESPLVRFGLPARAELNGAKARVICVERPFLGHINLRGDAEDARFVASVAGVVGAGVGRDDGKTKGEYSAIFYDTTRLKFLNGSTFWLSEHPDAVGVKGWDAALPRIVTWCSFEDKLTHKNLYAFNTHFDHMGKVARAESAKLLLQKVKEIAGNNPVIVTGDFNASDEDEPIKIIVDKSNAAHLTDSKLISLSPHYGPDGTFNGFQTKEVDDKAIDHIFIKNNLKVLKHATISESWNGRFSSDHFPVFAQISL